MSSFVFSVAPSGLCVLRSRRSFRRLSGGAVSACSRAVLAPVASRSAVTRNVARAIRRSRALRALPVVVPAPVVPPASLSGSRLFLLSTSFASVLRAGKCPLRFLLSVFRWPVRSALVLCLCRVFLSRPDALLAVSRNVRVAFLRSALASLGYSVSGACPPRLALSWLCPRRENPSSVPLFSGLASPAGLSDALSSLSRCLRWLSARTVAGKGCPPAIRSSLALLASLVASSLA